MKLFSQEPMLAVRSCTFFSKLSRSFSPLTECPLVETHLQGSNANKRGRNRQLPEQAFHRTTISSPFTPQSLHLLQLRSILRIISMRTKYLTPLSIRLSTRVTTRVRFNINLSKLFLPIPLLKLLHILNSPISHLQLVISSSPILLLYSKTKTSPRFPISQGSPRFQRTLPLRQPMRFDPNLDLDSALSPPISLRRMR